MLKLLILIVINFSCNKKQIFNKNLFNNVDKTNEYLTYKLADKDEEYILPYDLDPKNFSPTKIIQLIESNDRESLIYLSNIKTRILNQIKIDGNSLLMHAIKYKYFISLKELLTKDGLEILYVNHSKRNVLLLALDIPDKKIAFEIFKDIINYIRDFDARNKNLDSNNISLMKKFFSNEYNEIFDYSILHEILFHESNDLKYLNFLKKEFSDNVIDLEVTDYEGLTPLIFSIQMRKDIISKFLIDNGANIEYEDPKGLKVIDYVSFYNRKRLYNYFNIIEENSPFEYEDNECEDSDDNMLTESKSGFTDYVFIDEEHKNPDSQLSLKSPSLYMKMKNLISQKINHQPKSNNNKDNQETISNDNFVYEYTSSEEEY